MALSQAEVIRLINSSIPSGKYLWLAGANLMKAKLTGMGLT
tara:strand:+ start:44 stop:166 length:123 start_codon:yes stop_codon:yes gene_type:complete